MIARSTGVLACFAAVLAAGCTNASNPAPSIPTSQASVAFARGPHYAPTLSDAAAIRPDLAYVPYQGGPVIVDPKIYLIFWDYKKYGDPDKLQPLLESYTKKMGGSPHSNILTQYYQLSGSMKSFITNQTDQLGGSWNDESPSPKKPTDAQIAAEALKGAKHFGFDPNGIYVVATAHDRSEAGFGTHWCGYHSETPYAKKVDLPYTNLPYMPDAGKQCGANIITPPSDESGEAEGMTIMAGHEYGEAITDPFPFSSWSGVNGEIADYCAWHNMANDPFGNKSYTMQPMVSDATEACVQSYP
ncbi:MAG TPA: hypothetical protein VMU38_03500 [Candidatus Binatia bacterium]|nr:hypothetical protein [Candidatus Binatia bacterium]